MKYLKAKIKKGVDENDVVVVGAFPKLQRVMQYDVLSKLMEGKLFVAYLREMPFGRHWQELPDIKHRYYQFKEFRIYRHFYLNFGFIIFAILAKPRFVIFAQYATVSSFIFSLICILRKIPFVIWAERPGVSTYMDKSGVRQRAIQLIRKLLMLPFNYGAAEIWPVGPLANESYRHLLQNQKTFSTIPMPLNVEDYSFESESSDVSCGKIKFLFVGELSYRKGFDVILSTFRNLASMRFQVELHVYGTGALLNDLHELIELQNNIYYHGFLEMSEVPKAYSSGDIALCISRHDGWGNNVIEALASGVTVIASNKCDSACYAINDENGYMIEKVEQEVLENIIKEIVQNRPEIQLKKQKSRASVRTLTFEAVGKLMKERIEIVVERKY